MSTNVHISMLFGEMQKLHHKINTQIYKWVSSLEQKLKWNRRGKCARTTNTRTRFVQWWTTLVHNVHKNKPTNQTPVFFPYWGPSMNKQGALHLILLTKAVSYSSIAWGDANAFKSQDLSCTLASDSMCLVLPALSLQPKSCKLHAWPPKPLFCRSCNNVLWLLSRRMTGMSIEQ